MNNIADDFLRYGFAILDIQQAGYLKKLQELLLVQINSSIDGETLANLESCHKKISFSDINEARIAAYNSLNSQDNIIQQYYGLFKSGIDQIVGTELASQNKVNLSIQMPFDTSSILGLHTDTISGQSKFEVVAWLPITRAFKSNAMFIFSLQDSQEMMMALPKYQSMGMDKLFQDWESRKTMLELDPGQGLIFSSNLMHGNMLNTTESTRVSLNMRFKSLFSPYSDDIHSEKKIGSFYQPLNVLPATKLGLNIKEPSNEF
jgi:sporadic carbohydrate cluster 2OG-Fe(II) oxygenase